MLFVKSGVTWRPGATRDDRLLGYERLAGDLTFTDDVSGIAGGGDTAVPDSGQIRCEQDRPGASVRDRLTGTDTALDPRTVPTHSQRNGAVRAGSLPTSCTSGSGCGRPISLRGRCSSSSASAAVTSCPAVSEGAARFPDVLTEAA